MSDAAPKKASANAKRPPSSVKAELAEPGDANVATAPVTLRLKTLVERVVASTGGKKKGVKEVVEATLAQLGLALKNGEMLNLPEFGKVRVAKLQGKEPGSAMTLKLRPNGKAGMGGSPAVALAEPKDQG